MKAAWLNKIDSIELRRTRFICGIWSSTSLAKLSSFCLVRLVRIEHNK
jgi:hypothetical protein